MLFDVIFLLLLLPRASAIERYQQYFFQQFGYIGSYEETPDAVRLKLLASGQGDDTLFLGSEGPDEIVDVSNDVIKQMQFYADIQQTGVIDEATIAMMKTPRCQNPDIVGDPNSYLSTYYLNDPDEVMEKRKRNVPKFVRQKRFSARKWDKLELGVGFENVTPQNSRTVDIVMSAFEAWGECTNLSFQLKEQIEDADIRIKFASGEHAPPKGDKFDGRGGVLAHAWYPPTGLAHFDEEEDWANDCYLYSVALHEIGHLMGLDHSTSKTSIMFAYFNADDTICDSEGKRQLNQRDIENIRQKYGMKTCEKVADWSEAPGGLQDITTTPTTSPTMSKSGSFFNPGYTTAVSPFNGQWNIKCGDIEDNVLSSPNYPQIYPNAAICSWNISAPTEEHKIEIHLFEFELEEGDNGECVFDYLKLKYKDGNNLGDSKTQLLCGQQSGSISLKASYLELEFVSDSLKQFKGFKILFTFEAPPPCEKIYDETHGVIEYPNSELRADESCTFLIKADKPKKKIFLVIEELRVTGDDCQEDQFVLLDKIDNENINLITDLCSHVYRYDYFISASNENMTIITKPKEENQILFKIRYYSIEDSKCSKTLFDEGMWATPIGNGNKYPRNIDCIVYLANTDAEMKPSHLTFETLSIEYDKSCSYDFLEVYSDESGRQRFCGEDLQLSTMSFQSNALIYFHTDGSVESYGFKFEFYKDDCNEDIDDDSGRITSPQNSHGYMEGVTCKYKFKKDTDYFICFTGQFEIQGIDDETFTRYYQDYLELTTEYESEQTSYRFIEKPQPFVLSRESHLTFVSNNDGKVGAGFTFDYLAISNHQSQCYRYLTSDDFGKHQQYYSYRDESQTCVWDINASGGYGIEMEFRRIKLIENNCKQEFIRVYKSDCDDYIHICKNGTKRVKKIVIQNQSSTILFKLQQRGSFFNIKLKKIKVKDAKRHSKGHSKGHHH